MSDADLSTIQPVPIHLASVAEGLALSGGRPARRRRVTRFGTEAVDDANPARPLIPASPDLVIAYVQARGGDVFLCDSEAKAIRSADSAIGGPITVTAPFAAAGPGVAALPLGASLTGFTVTGQKSTSAESGTLTITNVEGGPLIYDVVFPNGSNSTAVLHIPFPEPLEPDGGPITLTMSAVVGGPAGNINAYGQLAAAEVGQAELGTLLSSGNTAPWPVGGSQGIWIAQVTAGNYCVVSYTAEYDS